METILREARLALRNLRATPAFSLAAVLLLALGIGLPTTVFSIFHALLLRPLPFPEPGQGVRRFVGANVLVRIL
jgi:hypothetical protein